jgi:hypothetical protein
MRKPSSGRHLPQLPLINEKHPLVYEEMEDAHKKAEQKQAANAYKSKARTA